MLRRFTAVSVLGFACAGCASSDETAPQPPPTTQPPNTIPAQCTRTDLDTLAPPRPHTARWAFEPWISKDISDRDDTYAFVDGFRERNIPVGAVVLDSPWETAYNTFVPNEKRYRDMPGIIRDMHQRGVKVVLWITSMVNETNLDFEPGGDVYTNPAPNFDEGQTCKYFVEEGETFVWWKGKGASIDFFHPHAMAWWHRQQDIVLDAGIDGWKLDFGESYVKVPTVRTAAGPKPHQEYSEKYYEDFLAYGRKKRGDDFLTMVRAWDKSYDLPGRFFAKREHAPVAWMGDNRRDWIGLVDALDEAFISAKANYPVVGSDIGGYLNRDDVELLGPEIPFDTLNFARWIAVGALSPFMQLHGRGNFTPWTVPDHVEETVTLYRYWATLHHALVPYLYGLSEEAWAGGPPLLRPIGEPASWPNDYRYMLGDAFLVAPILDATGKRVVKLPAEETWIDWWTGAAASGDVAADFANDRGKIPLFVRTGAIVPMTVDGDVLASAGLPKSDGLTVWIVPSAKASTFKLHEEDVVTTITQSGGKIDLSAVQKRTTLRVRLAAAPSAVTLDGAAVPIAYDVATKTLSVEIAARSGPAAVVITTP